jgi:hypothetical protein
MRTRLRALARAAPALALVTVLLLMPLPRSWHGGWQGKFFDLGHVPLFGALTLYLWWGFGRSWLPAIATALALAGLAEIVQDWFGRSSSFLDFVRGALGIAAAFVLVRAVQGRRTLPRLAGHGLVIAALVAWPVADSGPWLLDAYEGACDFPTLADFATERQLLRWRTRQAVLQREPDPALPSGASARLDFLPGPEKYPAATLEPIVHDWSGRRRLCCSFRVDGGPLLLALALRSQDADGRWGGYDSPNSYEAGEHTAWLELREARDKGRLLNLADIRYVHLFTYGLDRERTVRLRRVWLE